MRSNYRHIEAKILLGLGNFHEFHLLPLSEFPSPPHTFVGAFKGLHREHRPFAHNHRLTDIKSARLLRDPHPKGRILQSLLLKLGTKHRARAW